MEKEYIFTEDPEEEIWQTLLQYSYEANIRKYLSDHGFEPTDDLVDNISGSILQAYEYYAAAKHCNLQIKPLLLYYGTTNLLYGVCNMLTGSVNTIHNHGMRITPPLKGSSIGETEISFENPANGGVHVFIRSLGYELDLAQYGNWTAKEMFSSVPELQADYKKCYGEVSSNNLLLQVYFDREVYTMVGDGSYHMLHSEMITALESQAQYMETYAANLEKAIQLGLSDSLVQALSDGSAESAAILQSIVEDGGQNIDALNEQFGKVQEGKEAFSQQMAEAATDYNARMTDIENRLGQAVNKMNQANAAYAAAVDTIRGNIAGAESMRGQLTNEYASLARAASQAYRNELQIRSPSKVMEKNAVYTVEGIIEGARKMLPKVEQTFDDIGAATVGSYGAGASSYSAPDIGQYNVQPTTVVNVHLGDRELTNVMYSGIVKKIESTNRNASAAAGRI